MIIDNRLDKSFGPSASFAGYILFVVGLVSFLTVIGIFIALIGAFVAFSFSGVRIDIHNNRFQFYTKLFGLFKTGKWHDIKKYKEIAILKNNKIYTAHSRSNRTIDIKQNGFYIYMLTPNHKERVPLKKCKTIEIAKLESDNLCKILNMSFVNY